MKDPKNSVPTCLAVEKSNKVNPISHVSAILSGRAFNVIVCAVPVIKAGNLNIDTMRHADEFDRPIMAGGR